MDKLLKRYSWNTMFSDFQEDVLDIGYAIDTDDKKTNYGISSTRLDDNSY